METMEMNENMMEDLLDAGNTVVTDIEPASKNIGFGQAAVIAVGAVLLWEGGKFAWKKLGEFRSGKKAVKNVVNADDPEVSDAQNVDSEEVDD